MRIIIDFDYTIFDTNALRKQILARIGDPALTLERYVDFEHDVIEQHGVYIPDMHKELIVSAGHSDPLTIDGAFESSLEDAQECLYHDVLPYIEHARRKASHMMLLSFGTPEWQTLKIMSSGIEGHFDEVLVTDTKKEDAIGAFPNLDTTVFINDRGCEIDGIKHRFPEIRAVWLRRPGTPYYDEECTQYDEEHAKLTDLID